MLCKQTRGKGGNAIFPLGCFMISLSYFCRHYSGFCIGAAKLGIGTAGGKNPFAELTVFQCTVRISQHKAEHHLQAPQEGDEVL